MVVVPVLPIAGLLLIGLIAWMVIADRMARGK
jgi:hypothetical protein